MHLVQLLLPLKDVRDKPFPRSFYSRIREELTERFGGMTAYSRAPAEGLWDGGGDRPTHDDIVVYEVMVDDLQRDWWASFRKRLEQQFEQDEMVVRAQVVERL